MNRQAQKRYGLCVTVCMWSRWNHNRSLEGVKIIDESKSNQQKQIGIRDHKKNTNQNQNRITNKNDNWSNEIKENKHAWSTSEYTIRANTTRSTVVASLALLQASFPYQLSLSFLFRFIIFFSLPKWKEERPFLGNEREETSKQKIRFSWGSRESTLTFILASPNEACGP